MHDSVWSQRGKGLGEWRVYICEAAGSAGKPMWFANSSHFQLNKLMASLVPDKKRSVRKAWVCFLLLSHTHGRKAAACLQHFLCIFVYDLWVVEKKWHIILFLLSFLPGQQETLGDYICSQCILQKWPKLLLIVVAGLNSCSQCVYNWRDKQFVLKIMTNHLYLVYKSTVCSLNTCTRNCVCEGKPKYLHEQCPAWSCRLWDAGSAHPALVKEKKNFPDLVFCQGMGTWEQALIRSEM